MQLADPSLLKDQCLIDGKWVGEGVDEIRNPATGALIASVPRFGFDETVGRSRRRSRAFGPWAKACRRSARKSCAAGSTSSSPTATTSRSS